MAAAFGHKPFAQVDERHPLAGGAGGTGPPSISPTVARRANPGYGDPPPGWRDVVTWGCEECEQVGEVA